MDLSMMSTADLQALQAGDMSKVSDAGLKMLAGPAPQKSDPSAGGSTLNLAGFDTGIKTPEWLDRTLVGAGKAVSDLGNGVRQIGALAGLGDKSAVQADIDEHKRFDAPVMNTTAGLVGNVLGNTAMTLLPAGAVARGAQAAGMARTAAAANAFINPTTYTGAVGAGATLGALQPVASDESRLLNTGLGAVTGGVGQGIVNGLGRIAQPVKNALEPTAQKAVDTLKGAGVPLDLAQVTGSPAWQRIRSALNDNLFTLGGQAAKTEAQKDAFTNAALGMIGASGKATGDVMGAAENRINGVFKDVLDRNSVKPDPGWITRLTDAQAGAIENEKAPVASIVNRIFNAMDPHTGEIPGQVAYGIKKDLDRMASGADTTQNYFARQARSALMDGINGSLSGADQKAFATARGQFANMKKIEGAVSNDGLGDISPAKLANILGQKANRGASLYGKGPQELVDLAQAGKQLLGDKTPNSGTFARAAAAVLPGALVAGGTQLATGDPLEAAKYGATVFALPKAAQYMLNKPSVVKYLSEGLQPRGLLGGSGPTLRGLLESPQNSLIAGQVVRRLPGLLGAQMLLPNAAQQ